MDLDSSQKFKITILIFGILFLRLLFAVFFQIPVLVTFLTSILIIQFYVLKEVNLKKIVGSGIIPLGILFLVMLVYINGNFPEILNEFLENYEKGAFGVQSLYENIGVPLDDKVIEDVFSLLIKLSPAIEFILSLAGLVVFYAVASNILSQDDGNIPQIPSVIYWESPDWFLWILIASLSVTFLTDIQEVTILGMNILALCAANYFLQGIAVIQFFFITRNIPSIARIIFYVLLFLQSFLIIFVILLGIIDLWKDFRKFNLQEEV